MQQLETVLGGLYMIVEAQQREMAFVLQVDDSAVKVTGKHFPCTARISHRPNLALIGNLLAQR